MARHLYLYASLFATAAAQTIAPFPLANCGGVVGAIETQCATANGCCAAGPCCAGGCCPLTAVCINSGTPDEGCCNAGDPSQCGYYTAPTVSSAINAVSLE
jgi:hypothetical protein